MKQIIVFPRGQLDAKDKERLTKAGVIAIEADDPSKVVTVLPISNILSADDVANCMAQAIRHSTNATGALGTLLANKIVERCNR